MKIAFNPSTVAALIAPPNNKDITFDLRGHNIFARGVKFCGTDTNTWRDIKINNVSIDSNILDLRDGSNTTLINTDGVVTINSTWRPVVDNLTSDSTTSSLSANQGRVLAGLINGKSDSNHNHDGRYLRLNGSDTMQGNLNLCSIGNSYIGKGLGDKSGADFTEANIVIRSWWGISFKSYDDIVRTYIDTRTGNIGTKGVLNAVGAVILGRIYNGGDDEGILIKKASNGWAGLILGSTDSDRSCFYLGSNSASWKYVKDGIDTWIQHPYKNGTIALTSDIPSSLKNPYSLTTFGVVYDGSAAKTVTTSTFISLVTEDTDTVTDGTMFITSWASNSGFEDTNAVNVPYKRKAIHLWEYIKAKTDYLYATKSHNHDDKYLRWLGNAKQSNMNAIGRISHSSGMTDLSDPGNTIDNPMEGGSKSTSWHLYWLTNYIDDPSGSNAWVALIVNKAGTDRWWVRSRSGGTITNNVNWNSNWRFLVTAPTSGLGNGNLPVYINSAGEVVAANSYPTTLPANGGNADTVDGEHASNFVRAGVYDSADLNKLDTYSFIKSVNSNNKDTSPKGNTGWYNVILAVHRNGNVDGPSYIGQIALGMTINTNDMFFRGRRTDSWKTVIHSGNISSQTVANAYHLRINSANTWSTWYWLGLSGLPTWLWGCNDGGNMYVWSPSNFRVASATKLATARTIWGQSFDGTGNVDGTLRIRKTTSGYCEGIRIQTADNAWSTIILGATGDSGTNANAWSIHRKDDNNFAISRNSADGTNGLVMTSVGMGLGTTAPEHRLDVRGNIRATGFKKNDSSDSYILLGGGGHKAISDFVTSDHNHDNVYLKLTGGTMLDLSRISVNGDLYIGDADNNGYLYFQDIASLDGSEYWSISTDGHANFYAIEVTDNISVSTIDVSKYIQRPAINSSWVAGRDNALLRDTSSNGYHPLWSLKTTNGSWEFGEYNSPNWYDVPVLSYVIDTDYATNNNQTKYQIKFPLASGTVALTSNIPNPTNYYWADVKISSTANSMTLPLFYSVKAYQYSLTNANSSESYNLAYLYNNIINIGSNSLVMHINASNILFYANSTLCIDINTQGYIGIGKTASLSALLTVASITELTTLKLLVDGEFRLQPVCVACGKVIDPISSININVSSSLNITATYTNNHYRINLANLRSSMISQNNVYAQITPITKYVSYRTEAIKDGSYIYLDVYCNARTSFYFCVWAY